MFIQLFGKYLQDKGAITKEILSNVLSKKSDARAKLGVIAVADNYLTEQQANEINHLQMTMDKRFGDIAIEKGYLTESQLEALIAKQGNEYMTFIQLLVDGNYMTLAQIDEYVNEFQKENGFSDSDIEALKNNDINAIVSLFAFASKPYVTDIAGLVLRNITRFVTTNYYIEKMKKVDSFEYNYLVAQNSTGNNNVYIGFASDGDDAGLMKLASLFSKCDYSQINENVLDATAEFVNVNSGLWTSELSKKNEEEEMDMLPPVAYKKQAVKGNVYVLPIVIENATVKLFVAVGNEDIELGKELHEINTGVKEGSIADSNSKGTCLIVDDSRMSRTVLRDIIEQEGYTVIGEAANGEDGVEAFKNLHPDIVTLDITMPVKDGIEALKDIKEYDSDAKVVMISAAGQQKKIIEALKFGADKFVVKPFEKEDVLKAFEEML